MKNSLKVLSLVALAIWSLSVWGTYFDEKKVVHTHVNVEVKGSHIPADYELSDNFWAWEAQGRLNLIDVILDVERDDDLNQFAQTLISLQNVAYGVEVKKPPVRFVEMRGEANGLYIPEDKTIYLNAKMDWHALSIERFAEVVLHENMHHILTHSGIDDDDFKYLSLVGFHHHELAMDGDSGLNPQEDVAYRTQRAGRYVALNHRDLSVWEISTRMQEIRSLDSRLGAIIN